jgi:hypothetical protein
MFTKCNSSIKDFLSKYQISLKVVLSLFIGFFAFNLVADIAIINPQNADWLMEGDPATHFLGWQFFRSAPFSQWPFGLNPNYGMEIGSSIVFTDSLPLFAFLFKPISSYLPAVFQYIGLWILVSFLLQSYFAWKLLSKFTKDTWLPFLGSAFFVIAPFLLFRLRGHYALFGQWVILAALCLYNKKNYKTSFWVLLLSATALIHAYLLIMVSAIWSADMTQRLLIREKKFLQVVGSFTFCIATTIFVMWFAGYFMFSNGGEAWGFGFFRMNLLSMINPDDLWSRILRDHNGGDGDYEGFNFLGIGIIQLAIFSIFEFIKNKKIIFHVSIMPICVLSLLLFSYAISNKIAIGSHEIFSYSLPPFMNIITGNFRVSGRFFWPVAYIIYLSIFYLIFTRMKPRPALVLCALLLIIQIVDSNRAFSHFKDKFSKIGPYVSSFRSLEWNEIANNYKKVLLVLPSNIPENWIILSEFAVANHMSINTGYFARIDNKQLHHTRIKLVESIISNTLDPEALYFFENGTLWNLAISQLRQSDVAGLKDGFRFIAPNFKGSADFNNGKIKFTPPLATSNFSYNLNETIYFTTKGLGSKFGVYGWSGAEPWGTWSDGDSSFLVFNIPHIPKSDLNLMIEGHAFLAEKHPVQEIDVYLKDHYLNTLKYTLLNNGGIRTIKIPKELIADNNPLVSIRFNYKNPNSPAALGLSADGRRLGLGIISIQLKQGKVSSQVVQSCKEQYCLVFGMQHS